MPVYDVDVSVSSAPTNAAIKLDGQEILLDRDADGNWAGSAKKMPLSNPAAMNFRAVGISGDPWTLTISFKPPRQAAPNPYKHDDNIPDDGLSIFTDEIPL